MHYQNNYLRAVQLMRQHDEIKFGTYFPIGGTTKNLLSYINENIYLGMTGRTKFFGFSEVWK